MTHPFAKKLTTSPSKPLALLGLGVLLTTAVPTVRAQEGYESIRSNANKFLSTSQAKYQEGGRQFLAFWEQEGPTIHRYLEHSPSNAPVQAWELAVKEFCDHSPPPALCQQWRDAFFDEAERLIRQKEFFEEEVSEELGRECSLEISKMNKLADLLADKSWDDPQVRTRMGDFYRANSEAHALFFAIVHQAEEEVLGRQEYAPLKQALELCSTYGVYEEQRVTDQVAAQETAGVPPDCCSHAPVLGVGILDRKLAEKMTNPPKNFTMPSQDRFTQWRKVVAARQKVLLGTRAEYVLLNKKVKNRLIEFIEGDGLVYEKIRINGKMDAILCSGGFDQ
jgi:hypothetical protein